MSVLLLVMSVLLLVMSVHLLVVSVLLLVVSVLCLVVLMLLIVMSVRLLLYVRVELVRVKMRLNWYVPKAHTSYRARVERANAAMKSCFLFNALLPVELPEKRQSFESYLFTHLLFITPA